MFLYWKAQRALALLLCVVVSAYFKFNLVINCNFFSLWVLFV